MALFGYPDLIIELDDSGSTARNISDTVTAISGHSIDSVLEEITGASGTVDAWAAVGVTKKGEITLSGPYDNTANKLVALTKGAAGSTRTLKLTFDGATAADVLIVECIIKSIKRNPSRDALTQYEVVFQPTGAIT